MESYHPDPPDDEEALDAISLEMLHDEMAAMAAESRRESRRALDALKNFSSVLDAISSTVSDTHKAVRAIPATSPQAQGAALPHAWALEVIELADRISRVSEGFSRPPATTEHWWPGARKPLAAWADAWAMQADAMKILTSHAQATLTRAGMERLVVLGQAFDPATMTAVESTVDGQKPDHTVLAEILPGWRDAATGQLVRTAQVRVSRHPAH